MRKIDGTFPPPHVLKALRAHARDRPCTRRLLTRAEVGSLPLSRVVEIGTADDILAAWQKRCRFRGSRPGLRTLLVLAASEAKREGENVRSIVAKLRDLEEDLRRRIEEGRQHDAAVEARRQRLLREREDRVQEIE